MREIVHTETSSAARSQVWLRYADVAGWPNWDQGLAQVRLPDGLVAGARGRIRLHSGRARRVQIGAVDPGTAFTDVARLPMLRVTTLHLLADAGSGTSITHRVHLGGPLGRLFPRLVGAQVAASLPSTMARLARLAERSSDR